MLHRLAEYSAYRKCGDREVAVLMALLVLCETAETREEERGITLLPGQTTASLMEVAEVARISKQRAITALRHLEEWGFIVRLGVPAANPPFAITTLLFYDEVRQGAFEPRRALTVTPPPDKEPIAASLYRLYLKTVNPDRKTRKRAIRNLIQHLGVYTEQELEHSIQAYARVAAKSRPEYRKDPANFFGIIDPVFDAYLPGEAEEAPPDPEIARIDDLVRRRMPEARIVYETRGKAALASYCDRYDLDPDMMEERIRATG